MPGIFLHGAPDELHDQDCLADSRATEHSGLAASGELREKVHDLDPGAKGFAFIVASEGQRGRWENAISIGLKPKGN